MKGFLKIMGTSETAKKWVVLAILGCLLFSGTLFLTNLGKRDLWRPDEPRYAEVAREMVLNHQYLVPRINHQPYTQKSPLFFWMVAGSFKAFHKINEWTARFPVALSAVFCVLLTFLIGKRLFDISAGFFSALLLATTVEFFWLVNRVNLDTTMTLFILLSLYAIVRALKEDDHQNLWFRLAFLFSGIATVTKGPLGLIVPFLTLIVYLLVKGDFRTFKKVPWFSGAGIFLLVILVGLGPTCLAGGKAYTRELILRQTLTRYLHGINHRKGFFYYFYTFPEIFLPWVIFLPAAILFALKKGKEKVARTSFLFIVIWVLANLFFLSFSKSKRELYILSVIPAACLFLGAYVSAIYKGAFPSTLWFRFPVYFLGVLAIVTGIAFPFAPYAVKMRFPELILPFPPFVFTGVLMIVSGGLLCFLNGARKTKAVVWVLILSFYALFFAGAGYILPQFDRVKSLRVVGKEIQTLNEKGYDVRMLCGLEPMGILFYTKLAYLPVVPPAPWEMGFLKTTPKAVVVLMKRQLPDFARMANVPLKVLWKKKAGGRNFLVLQPEVP